MGFARRAEASIARMTRRFGGGDTATLRRPLALTSQSTGTLVTALALVGTHASGATSLTIDATSAKGTVPAGVTLTVAGVAGTYTTQADASASSNSITVTVSPGLASEGADDAVVTLTTTKVDYTLHAAEMGSKGMPMGGGLEEAGVRKLLISPVGVSVLPEVGDHIVWQSDVYAITAAEPHRIGSDTPGVVVTLGGRQ